MIGHPRIADSPTADSATTDLAQTLSPRLVPEGAKDMSAPCPKCRAAMVYVTALPHPIASEMRRTVFLCSPCNQTRNYSLSVAMAEAYAALFAPPSEPAASMREAP
jgi:hypothetical protein